MKAISLLFLRVSTALLIIIWGLVKVRAPEKAIGVSEKYYGGAVSAEMLQMPWGLFQLAVGALVILGLFRRFAYPLQAAILCLGALVIWNHLLDPFGLYLFAEKGGANILFFPSLCLAAATLVIWAFRDEDTLSLDAMRRKD
ncbi:MAG: hypothetical protein V3V15_02850 [Sphingorhabdus sp.]